MSVEQGFGMRHAPGRESKNGQPDHLLSTVQEPFARQVGMFVGHGLGTRHLLDQESKGEQPDHMPHTVQVLFADHSKMPIERSSRARDLLEQWPKDEFPLYAAKETEKGCARGQLGTLAGD